MSTTQGSNFIFTITGDTKNQPLTARAQYGKMLVFIKDGSHQQYDKTRAWYIAKKAESLKGGTAIDKMDNIVRISNAYANVIHNKCVYDDEVMREL